MILLINSMKVYVWLVVECPEAWPDAVVRFLALKLGNTFEQTILKFTAIPYRQ